MKHRLIITPVTLLMAWCAGCTASDPDPAADAGPDTSIHDMAGDQAGDQPDGATPSDIGPDAAVICYDGWSGEAGCCLQDTARAAGPTGCPAGTFDAASCGRIDPICEGADLGPPDMGAGDFVAEGLAAVNAARASSQDCGAAGMLGPVASLTLSTALTTAAQARADDMAARLMVGQEGGSTRDRTNAAGYSSEMVSEAYGFGHADAAAAVAAFIAFDGTCGFLMDAARADLGVGMAVGTDQQPYWSFIVGTP